MRVENKWDEVVFQSVDPKTTPEYLYTTILNRDDFATKDEVMTSLYNTLKLIPIKSD